MAFASGKVRAGDRAPPPPSFRVAQATPEPSLGYGPSPFTDELATPRQLFKTPNTTLQRLQGLNLGAASTLRPAPGPSPPGPGPSCSSYAAAVANGPTAASRPAGYGPVPSYGPSAHALPGPGPGARRPYLGADGGVRQAWAPHYPSPYLQPKPPPQQQPGVHGVGLPFSRTFVSLAAQLAKPGENFTSDALRSLLAQYEATRLARPSFVAPTREEGGYIPDDYDAADDATSRMASEARALSERMKNAIATAVRTANAASNPRVVSAASGGAAARASLAVSQAVAGPETMAAVERKVAAHEQEVQRVRRAAEEGTRQQVAAVKISADAHRTQRAQQNRLQSERLRQVSQPPSQPEPKQQAQASAAAAAGHRGTSSHHGAARAAAGKVAKPPAPPPVDDDVVDLLSSDEEEEVVEEPAANGAQEESGEGEEGEEDDEAQYGEYGGPWGAYGDEGNRALARATAAERATWRRVFDKSGAPAEPLIAYKPNPATSIELPREKLLCMAVGTWLNDEIINLYVMLLQARDQRMRSRPFVRCHFFSSFFYNKLFADAGVYDYSNVRRWTALKKLRTSMQDSPNVLEVDRIVIPIHKGVHWTCAEIDLKARAVRYYDSLMGEDRVLVRNLKAWVQDEALDKLQQRWDTSGWRVEFPKNIPEQGNGCDCGVFTCMFADCLGAGRPMDFSQADMNLLRIKVLHRVVETRID